MKKIVSNKIEMIIGYEVAENDIDSYAYMRISSTKNDR